MNNLEKAKMALMPEQRFRVIIKEDIVYEKEVMAKTKEEAHEKVVAMFKTNSLSGIKENARVDSVTKA